MIPAPKSRKIEDDVLAVLSGSFLRARTLTLPGALERSLYLRTNKVIEALGGKWNRRIACHEFDADAAPLIDAVILTGAVELPSDFGFFPTPAWLVRDMIERAAMRPGMTVLEPSAGDGAIATPLRDTCEAKVFCVELQGKNVAALEAIGFEVAESDFMEFESALRFDRVLMNPPFARRADVHHVTKAFRLLRAGGRLVAIMSAGVTFRDDVLTNTFREFVADHDGTIEPLPDESFKTSGTAVRTVIVQMDARP